MINFSEENAMVSYINKQRRTNHKDYQNGLFACFLSQQEPKKAIHALTDPSWIEAMFQVTPKTLHLYVVKRIFRYLKGQPKLALWYLRDSPFDLEAFSNSDYNGASLDRKSTKGCCQFLDKEFKPVVEKRLVLNGCLNWIATTAKNEIQASAIGLTYYWYALTVSPTIYTSCIKQFWTSTKVKTVNEDVRLQALVDGKKVILNEASIRCDLRLDDAEGTACLPNAAIFEELARMG
nr:uncharacterized mitochondrial protein AtMg00810-like [Tanacetum cinerariifolium]